MAKFSDGVKQFSTAVTAKNQAIFAGAVTEAKNSIQFGSSITGAPGQPVGDPATDPNSGNLRGSWQEEFLTPTSARISTNVAYAESNEDGVARPGGGPYHLHSAVGGRHSVKLTIAGMPAIVAAVTKQLDGTLGQSGPSGNGNGGGVQ